MVRCELIGLAKEVPPHHIGMNTGGGAHWSRGSRRDGCGCHHARGAEVVGLTPQAHTAEASGALSGCATSDVAPRSGTGATIDTHRS